MYIPTQFVIKQFIHCTALLQISVGVSCSYSGICWSWHAR